MTQATRASEDGKEGECKDIDAPQRGAWGLGGVAFVAPAWKEPPSCEEGTTSAVGHFTIWQSHINSTSRFGNISYTMRLIAGCLNSGLISTIHHALVVDCPHAVALGRHRLQRLTYAKNVEITCVIVFSCTCQCMSACM